MMEGGWGRDEGDGMVDIARTSFSGIERTWDIDAVFGEEILDMKERNWEISHVSVLISDVRGCV
jgi:hypothetical protein